MVTDIPFHTIIDDGEIFITKSYKSYRGSYYDIKIFSDGNDEQVTELKHLCKRLQLNGFNDKSQYYNFIGVYTRVPEGIIHAFLASINELYFGMEAEPWIKHIS